MKTSNLLTRFAAIFTTTACIAAWGLAPARVMAAEEKAAVAQETFASPDDAIKALQAAAQGHDRSAWDRIFGPGANLLLTGDKTQDDNHLTRFAHALAENCQQVPEGENKIVLEIGATNWPFPIPLVKTESQWHFDTDAGREEIIDRHIGRDELNAIGVCRAYLDAQRQYYVEQTMYAEKFRSAEGKKDGLYWETADGQAEGPLAALANEAHAEGPHPFHGYYFRILTRQGEDAPGGKMNYMHHGKLIKGFALVAYPEHWDQSGVMTFIVNQDGKIYQRNLGEKSREIGASMKEYNPNGDWTVVEDQGVFEK